MPGSPAGYSQALESQNQRARRRSGDGERAQPAARGGGSRGRGTGGIPLAVKAAHRPRRSKNVPLPGLPKSNRDRSNASGLPHAIMPRASQPARARVLVHLLTSKSSHALTMSASSRWYGCGCCDVLRRWVLNRSLEAASRPYINCFKCACGASPPPHPECHPDLVPSSDAGLGLTLGMGVSKSQREQLAAKPHTRFRHRPAADRTADQAQGGTGG